MQDIPAFIGVDTVEDIVNKIDNLLEKMRKLNEGYLEKTESLREKSLLVINQFEYSNKLKKDNQTLLQKIDKQKNEFQLKSDQEKMNTQNIEKYYSSRIKALQESLEFSSHQSTQLFKEKTVLEERCKMLKSEVADLKLVRKLTCFCSFC